MAKKAKAKPRPKVCLNCKSKKVTYFTYWQYFLLLSTIPIIVIFGLAIFMNPMALMAIPIIYLINRRSARKYAPMIICKSCKHIIQVD